LADLVGKKIAFEDQGSFSGYFLPRYLMEKERLPLVELPSIHHPVDPDAINYVFARTEKNIALWVDKGITAAGAVNTSDWQSVNRIHPDIKLNLKKLTQSEAFPRAYELLSTSLPSELRSAIKKNILELDISRNEEVMLSYEKTTRFESVEPAHIEQLKQFYRASGAW
jgi:phosphonate transport system substrate-binding protein